MAGIIVARVETGELDERSNQPDRSNYVLEEISSVDGARASQRRSDESREATVVCGIAGTYINLHSNWDLRPLILLGGDAVP